MCIIINILRSTYSLKRSVVTWATSCSRYLSEVGKAFIKYGIIFPFEIEAKQGRRKENL